MFDYILFCFLSCFVLNVFGQALILSDVDCYNVVSSRSGSGDDATTRTGTCRSGYTMTGCTVRTMWKNLDGSYISGGRCYGKNGHDGNGVWAHGRCCNIHVDSCEIRSSSRSSDCDDCSTTVSCSDGEKELTGCTHYTSWKDMDGSYPGLNSNRYKYSLTDTSNLCTARNGNSGNGIYAQARCCQPEDDYTLECKTIWGDKSGSGDDATSEIICPNDYFLSDCTSYTRWKDMDGSYFNGDICVAQNGHGGNGVWAVAICCREFYSQTPTNYPTDRPTNVPGI